MEIIKDLKNAGHYTAPEGYEIVNKTDKTNRTKSVWLSKNDSIENYELQEEEKPADEEKMFLGV